MENPVITVEGMTPELAVAIIKAQTEVRAALKTSTNSFHGYRYAGAEEVLIVGREALLNAGLAMIPGTEDFKPIDSGARGDECGGACAIIRTSFKIVHSSGAFIVFSTDVPVVAEKGNMQGWRRPADKATFAARTEALGYALRDFLLIPRKDANDVSGRRDSGGGEQQQQRTPEPMTLAKALQDMTAALKFNDVVKVMQRARAAVPKPDQPALAVAFVERADVALAGVQSHDHLAQVETVIKRLRLEGESAVKAQQSIETARSRLNAATGSKAT